MFLSKLAETRSNESYEENYDRIFINPFSYLKVRKMKLDNVKLYIDSYYLCLILNFFGFNIKRTSFDFTSIADETFINLKDNQKKVAIIGSTELNNKKFVELMKVRYEGIDISYCRDGFFNSDLEKHDCFRDIIDREIDVVIVGMGSPLQEQFLEDIRNYGWSGAGYTCGGFIHQTVSAKGEYYPHFIDKYNLRFLYRVFDEPKLIKRYLFIYPYAFFLIVFNLFRWRFDKKT